jgi:hypothetical protein
MTKLSRFYLNDLSNTTIDELRQAHAYAYGGCVIQDMGYYPFGSRFFSHLTHYVRSGDFVQPNFGISLRLSANNRSVIHPMSIWIPVGGRDQASMPLATGCMRPAAQTESQALCRRYPAVARQFAQLLQRFN